MNAPVAIPPQGYASRIGPNSVLQLIPLLDESLGPEVRERLLLESGIRSLPRDEGLMDERPAAALHQAVRAAYPDLAPTLTHQAGERTGDYIIRHRMPVAALRVLRSLPSWLSAPLLANIIERHAWTFAGSGDFRVLSKRPVTFELRDNPVVRGESSDAPLCHWHAAVFERLYTSIVDPRAKFVETSCCAMGAPSCRFEMRSR